MKKAKCVLPDKKYLDACFSYDGEQLWWRNRPQNHFKSARVANMWNAKHAGKRAGRDMPTSNYRQVGLDGVRYLEHRLIAALHDMDLSGVIDHIDGNGKNNRLCNLRSATQAENCRNNKGWGRSLPTGVHQRPNGKFIALIRANGRMLSLGTFDFVHEAHEARKRGEEEWYGTFSRTLSAERGVEWSK